jgi:predicted nuclease with TOPRIM domain
MSKDLSELRERTNLSQQNWIREKDELLEQESYLQSEFEQAKEAMHNWEVLAMEERSIRESLGEKVIDLEEQLANVKDSFEKASAERDSQTATVDGLQRALQEIQAGELLTRPSDRCALLTQHSAQTGASRTRREL